MKLLGPTLFLLTLATSAQDSGLPKALPSGGTLRSEQACFDVQHVRLELDVNPLTKRIAGAMTLTAKSVFRSDVIELDLDFPLEVESVELDGEPIEHERRPASLVVPLPKDVVPGDTFGLRVAYAGVPREAIRAPWDGGFTWGTTPDGQPWITTTCQGEGGDLWWPCKDHPSDKPDSFELAIRVPKGLVCASNGVLVKTEDTASHSTFHWRVVNPISNYNIALNIGPFEVSRDTYRSIGGEELPIEFYHLPRSGEQARALLPEVKDHLAFFERFFGPYPFRNEKYGIVETPHLGMEHQTIIAYGYGFKRDRNFDYDWLHHHELSHEWWGNLVTCRDWKDMWIHEGFGTYAQALYVETKHGAEGYQKQIREHMRSAANHNPIAPRNATNSKDIYFGKSGKSSNDIYYKGSAVIHSLRFVVGDEPFFQSLLEFCYPTEERRAATDGSQVRFVDTDEYIGLIERLSDRDLDWFFDVYAREASLPKLEVRQSDERVELRWEASGPFPMPVPLRVDGRDVRVECPKGRGSLRVPKGAMVELDPDSWVFRDPSGD